MLLNVSNGTGEARGCRTCPDYEVHEVFVVVETNAIDNPRAMVIHLQHTGITLSAVMAPLRTECSTLQAIPEIVVVPDVIQCA